MIIYIDFASSGDAGFYASYWSKALHNSNIKYIGIVNRDCDVKDKKIKKISLTHQNKKTKLQLPLIYLSHLLILIFIIAFSLIKRPVIIYNLHQPFSYWKNFNSILKFLDVKCFPIVHDIVEFETENYPSIIISNNKNIINLNKYAIIHKGKEAFVERYKSIPLQLEFPNRPKFNYSSPLVEEDYILLPGWYRKEKGFEFVLKNWPIDSKYKLLLACELPMELKVVALNNSNIIYINKKTNSLEFESLIYNCKGAILLYEKGTNSGLLETLIANNKRCLTSEIKMFKNHYFEKEFIFSKIDKTDFVQKIYQFEGLLKEQPNIIYERKEIGRLNSYIGLINDLSSLPF